MARSDEHELIHLLDSIEDERARSRFRESIYISLFIWIAIAWLVLYGPRYLWHAPKLVTPFEVLKQRELTQLNMPSLHAPPPSVPRPQPKVDNRTLEHLRSMEPPPPRHCRRRKRRRLPDTCAVDHECSSARACTGIAATECTAADADVPTPPVVAEAPTPQPSTKPNFNTNGSAENAIQNATRNAARNPGGGGYGARKR